MWTCSKASAEWVGGPGPHTPAHLERVALGAEHADELPVEELGSKESHFFQSQPFGSACTAYGPPAVRSQLWFEGPGERSQDKGRNKSKEAMQAACRQAGGCITASIGEE